MGMLKVVSGMGARLSFQAETSFVMVCDRPALIQFEPLRQGGVGEAQIFRWPCEKNQGKITKTPAALEAVRTLVLLGSGPSARIGGGLWMPVA